MLYFISFVSILSNMLLFIKFNKISGNEWFSDDGDTGGWTWAAVIVGGGQLQSL